jgi:hypothetical protein
MVDLPFCCCFQSSADSPVGAAEGCDLLIFIKAKDRPNAARAFGSSYRVVNSHAICEQEEYL